MKEAPRPDTVYRNLRNDRGASIVAVVILISIITVLGVIFVSLFSTGVEESTAEATSTRALHIAEGGVEAAVGRLKKPPVSANWTWNDGYKDKALGSGTVDVEVLEYEMRDGTLASSVQCEPFESVIEAAGANPARTVYISLAWSASNNLGLELYDNTVADCNNPLASANLIASSVTSNKPEVIRYYIGAAPPATLQYTVRITGGAAGVAYNLRISHPDESGFSSANTCAQPDGLPYDPCMRALIALGKAGNTRREVFAGFSRTP